MLCMHTPVQVNEALVRVVALLDPPETLFKPLVFQQFMAFEAAEYTPGPIRRLAAAALGPWWGARAAAAGVEQGEQETALKELMGW